MDPLENHKAGFLRNPPGKSQLVSLGMKVWTPWKITKLVSLGTPLELEMLVWAPWKITKLVSLGILI